MNLYQAILMDHYQNPRNYGTLENPDFESGEQNPSCGDTISLQGTINNNHITVLRFIAHGCVISTATASLLTEYVQNASLESIENISPEQLQEIVGITLGPLRLKCALLPLNALKKGIHTYQVQHSQNHHA
jgi:nitrogen fixation protein NifU and related proteins